MGQTQHDNFCVAAARGERGKERSSPRDAAREDMAGAAVLTLIIVDMLKCFLSHAATCARLQRVTRGTSTTGGVVAARLALSPRKSQIKTEVAARIR